MVGKKTKYTQEEVNVALEKGHMFISVLTPNQRTHLLACLLGLFIADGETTNITHMIAKVKATVR